MDKLQYKYYIKGVKNSILTNSLTSASNSKSKKIVQDNVYDESLNLKQEDDNDNIVDDEDKLDIKLKNIKLNIQTSNIIFPIDDNDQTNNYYGTKGFNKYFDSLNGGKSFKINDNMLKKYGNILDEKLLKKYSCKMSCILNYIKHSKGIVYIYSDYIFSGILPLALILEYNGYTKYGETQLLEGEKKSLSSSSSSKYILLSGLQTISQNNDREIEIASSDENLNGEKIKIILCTKIAGQGINLKRVREVHILDPWYHDKKLEQIIGRAIRYKSHDLLEKKYRNTTIYLYVSNLPENSDEYKKGIESIDLRIYRIAENKGLKVKKVENILKGNSFDCNLNWNENNININGTENIINSHGKLIKYDFNKNKTDNNYVCIPDMITKIDKIKKENIDMNTYNLNVHSINYNNLIIKLFDKKIFNTIEDIIIGLNIKNIDIIKEDIFNSLNNLIKHKIIFKTQNGEGYIIYKDDKYIFQPIEFNDEKIPLNYRNISKFKDYKKTKDIKILNNKNVNKEIENKNDEKLNFDKIINKININIKKNIEKYKLNNYINELYEFEFDNLEYKYQKYILENIILNRNLESNLNLLVEAIKKKYFIYNNKKEEYYGFKLINDNSEEEYYLFKDNKFSLMSKSLIDEINKNIKIDTNKNKNEIYGYIGYNKGIKNFKIVDNRENKNTILENFKEIKKQKKQEKTGFVCESASNLKKKDLEDIIKNLNKNIDLNKNNKKDNKKDMCFLLDIILRYNNNNNVDNKIWRE